ncbi:uncharacterized protein LOC108601256 [Drosophila busckii]|uniref:uncharacterized protein LOC108601256 n=1 Tax=Drosophila busckii TaxID=30019 RepID=UPI00083F006F|nr:uncharacterized protein LOC108601256 [Drosophila busckii]
MSSIASSLSIIMLLLLLPCHCLTASSGERVHIRLHMPEVVRKHTHFHNVYKHVPVPAPAPPKKFSAVKPHVSLLGYTTSATGSGALAPSLMQLMATAATPMHNYGPAFNLLATASAASGSKQRQQLLQQIFTPNIMAAITAAQQAKDEASLSNLASDASSEQPELEQNTLLNANFLAALQREYLSKFTGQRKRKKTNYLTQRRPQLQLQQALHHSHHNHVQHVASDEQFDDYQEEPNAVDDEPLEELELDVDNASGYDSAAAFSGQNNALMSMPSVDEFMSDVADNSYAPYYGNSYDDYAATANNYSNSYDSWQTAPAYARPTKATPTKSRSQPRRPHSDLDSSTVGTGKMRYVKLTARKKRKNRIKSKRYRL